MDIDPEITTKVKTGTRNQRSRLRKFSGIEKNQNEKTFDWLKKQRKNHKRRIINQLRMENNLYDKIIQCIDTNIKNKPYGKRLSQQKDSNLIILSIKECLLEMVNNVVVVACETKNIQKNDVINLLSNVKNNVQEILISEEIEGKDDILLLVHDVLEEIDLWNTIIHPK